MTITDTDNDQLNFEKFCGSDGIRNDNLRVTSSCFVTFCNLVFKVKV